MSDRGGTCTSFLMVPGIREDRCCLIYLQIFTILSQHFQCTSASLFSISLKASARSSATSSPLNCFTESFSQTFWLTLVSQAGPESISDHLCHRQSSQTHGHHPIAESLFALCPSWVTNSSRLQLWVAS